jgi:2-oxoglutarate/2-oxoacid ferredoxin oxidoreductase subunit alpha
VVRFAGDSGDGMQLTGGQFTLSTALAGNDLATFPDFPGRDPRAAGHAVRRLGLPDQLRLDRDHTAGDAPDVLVAMNPAALKTNLSRRSSPAG